MKKINTCAKHQEWVLLHPGVTPVASVMEHINHCSDCQMFWEQEKIIQEELAQIKAIQLTIPNEQTLKVKQAIWETSLSLSSKKQKVNYLFPKVAGFITVSTILLLFFFAPLFSGENYFGYQINQRFVHLLQNNESVSLVSRGNTSSTQDVKFVSQYVKTPAEKIFYYSTGQISKETYLMISFLAKKTGEKTEEIHHWLSSGGYAYMLRKLNLPYQKTLDEIESYLVQFRKSTLIPTMTLDGYILWVDYRNDQIWIDSYPRAIKMDAIAMHNVYIGLYATFFVQEKDLSSICYQMEDSIFPATILYGKLDFQDQNGIRIAGNPSSIQVTSKTIFNESIQAKESNQSGELLVRIRTFIHRDTMTAISITPYTNGSERTMTGRLDRAYRYGFTLKELDLSFCFDKDPTNPITNLPMGTILTVSGIDYGNYFLVSQFSIIEPPAPYRPQLLLAKVEEYPVLKRMKQIGIIDFVIAREGDFILLASGKKVSITKEQYSPGSKIQILPSENKGKPTISFLEMGSSTIFNGTVVLLKKLENGTYLFSSEGKDLKVILYPKKGEIIPNRAILQGIMIQYDNISIMVDYRLFLMKDLTTTKGIITKIMDKTKLLVLDNGMLVSLDDWSVITGEDFGVGKTVQLFGVQKQGILHAYLGSIEKEIVLFKGSIVEINDQGFFFKLDSGEIIFWNNQTKMQINKEKLVKGDLIYIRASRQGESFLAIDIWIPKEGTEDVGDNA